MTPYTPDLMRARLVELYAARDKIHAVANPIREARDALVRSGQPGREPLDTQLKEAEAGLGDIQNEIALLNIALGGYVA